MFDAATGHETSIQHSLMGVTWGRCSACLCAVSFLLPQQHILLAHDANCFTAHTEGVKMSTLLFTHCVFNRLCLAVPSLPVSEYFGASRKAGEGKCLHMPEMALGMYSSFRIQLVGHVTCQSYSCIGCGSEGKQLVRGCCHDSN